MKTDSDSLLKMADEIDAYYGIAIVSERNPSVVALRKDFYDVVVCGPLPKDTISGALRELANLRDEFQKLFTIYKDSERQLMTLEAQIKSRKKFPYAGK